MSNQKPSGISMARNVRLEILKRTRQILSVKDNWTQSYLRYRTDTGRYKYCLVGAMERAAYDLGYAKEDPGNRFDESDWQGDGGGPLGYRLASDVSIDTYANEQYGVTAAFNYNDQNEYEQVMRMLDEYIEEVEQGRAREPEVNA